jgi:prevent-host-death family protein
MSPKNHTTVTATDFKARCLELMDDVAAHRAHYLITKRGKVVAELVPPAGKVPTSFGWMSGTAVTTGDIVTPDFESWSHATDPLDR